MIPAIDTTLPTARQSVACTLARFSLDIAPGDGRLPPITDTLPVAELVRRSLLALCQRCARPKLVDADRGPAAPAFAGKDEHGRPRRGHDHAFFLPTDEDNDGLLDHVSVFVPMGLGPMELSALARLQQVCAPGRAPLNLLLTGLGNAHALEAPFLKESTIWMSATPFVATRYPKLRGVRRDRPEDHLSPAAFARHILEQELRRRSELPRIIRIDAVERLGAEGFRTHEFQRSRSKPSDDGGRRAAGGFRITFASAVGGPICLGHGCHFGLGFFVPVARSNGAREPR